MARGDRSGDDGCALAARLSDSRRGAPARAADDSEFAAVLVRHLPANQPLGENNRSHKDWNWARATASVMMQGWLEARLSACLEPPPSQDLDPGSRAALPLDEP